MSNAAREVHGQAPLEATDGRTDERAVVRQATRKVAEAKRNSTRQRAPHSKLMNPETTLRGRA